MSLQRAGNIEFRTVRGVLASAHQYGFSHVLIDDQQRSYLIEEGRKSERLDYLIGTQIEVKGLIETDMSPDSKIHLIYYAPIDSFQRVM